MRRLINGSKNIALFMLLIFAIPLISLKLGLGKIINSIVKDKSKKLSDLDIKRFGIKDANADVPGASCSESCSCATPSCTTPSCASRSCH